MFNFIFTPVVKNLLIINIVVFIIDNSLFPLTNFFGLRYVLSSLFFPNQFFTYMFLHADFGHLFFNMFALVMFGPLLERFWGSKKFLIFYMVTGIGAGLIYSLITYFQMYELHNTIQSYISNPTPAAFSSFIKDYASGSYYTLSNFIEAYSDAPTNSSYINESIEYVNSIFIRKADVPMIGASGAIFGILMAFGMLFPNTELFIFPFPIPIKAWLYVTVYGIIELYSGVKSAEGDNTAHFAHIGGMIFAFIMIRLWRENRHDFY